MGKRKPPTIGRCVHCIADNVKRNWDHVFPKSWYPDSTPPNTSKWIIPTCHVDARSRSARRDKILAEMMHGDEIPDQGIYPRLEERWNRSKEQQVALLFPERSFRRLIENVVRGIFYIEDGIFIEPSYSIGFYALHDAGAAPVMDLLDKFGTEHASGPGISIKRAVAPEDNISSFISIEVWKTFKMYASVEKATVQVIPRSA